MNHSLSIYAGSIALENIRRHGLHPDQVKVFVGASGGPKWFVLYGLDRYLFGDFFPQKKEKLYSIGSSAGAWRMACLARKRPVSAIARLAQKYSNEVYTNKPSATEVSLKARQLLDYVIEDDGVEEILSNKKIQTHIIAAKSLGLVASEEPWLQGSGLLLSAAANLLSRNNLRHFYERTVFHTGEQGRPFFRFSDFSTQNVQLTKDNLKDALMASGAIPMMLKGIPNIQGAETGIYRDGGMVDYHFDFRFNPGKELVLYPHFSARVVPGWFDKALKWRKITPYHFENVVLITPSAEFVDNLPYKKIPDRKDFNKMDPDTRQKYWHQVLSESLRMGDELKALVETGKGIDRIEPLSAIY